jgi:hypothetical protein
MGDRIVPTRVTPVNVPCCGGTFTGSGVPYTALVSQSGQSGQSEPSLPRGTRRALLWGALAAALLIATVTTIIVVVARPDTPVAVKVSVRAEPGVYQSPCPAPVGAVRFQATVTVDRGPVSVRYRWRRSRIDPTPVQEIRFTGDGRQRKTVSLDWAPGEGMSGWRMLEVLGSGDAVTASSEQAEYQVTCAPQLAVSAPADLQGRASCPYEIIGGRPFFSHNIFVTVTSSERPVQIRYRWSLTTAGQPPRHTPDETVTLGASGVGPGRGEYMLDPKIIRGPVTLRFELLAPVAVSGAPADLPCAPW